MAIIAAAVSVSIAVPASPAQAAEIGSSGWQWPLGSSPTVVSGGEFLGNGCGPNGTSALGGYGFYDNGIFHLGDDMSAAANTEVVAIGDGVVKGVWGNFGGDGGAVFIEHTAANGEKFVALYGHLKNYVTSGTVQAGSVVGRVNSDHTHFGIHPGTYSTFPSGSWGTLSCSSYWTSGNSPTSTNGFANPVPYLNAHPKNGGGGTLPSGASPIRNGGFNQNTSYWTVGGAANIAQYTSASGTGTNPYEGGGFGATNAGQAGESIYQTRAVNISAGDTYCLSASVVTVGNTTGGGGTLALWLLGGSTNNVSTYSFSALPGTNNWKPIKTCVTATTSQSSIKAQIYPTAGAPTIGVDAVDVHQTLNANGGFNIGMSYWNAQPGTNYAAYGVSHGTGTNPYEDSQFGATNTATAGGSLFQDLPRNISAGDTFCASAQVVTVGNTTSSAGALYVYLTGTNPTESSHYSFSGLPGGDSWTPIKSCVTATSAHSNIRVQLYPAVNTPTLGVDAVDVHQTLSANGGFNSDVSYWNPHASLSYMQYSNYSGTLPYEGNGFEVVQAWATGDSLYQDLPRNIAVGDTFCAEASVITPGLGSGASGSLGIWLLGSNGAENSAYSFSGLPGGNNWTHIKTCVTATIAQPSGTIRVQIYPSAGGAPVGIDAVDVH